MLLIAGVTHVCRNGQLASRLRLFWRSLVAWGTTVVALMLTSVEVLAFESTTLVVGTVLLMMLLTTWSLLLPERGLPGRLAGTWPAPR